MDALKELQNQNTKAPDGLDSGPWIGGDGGFRYVRRGSGLKTVSRSHSFGSNAGDRDKPSWRNLPGLGSRSRSSLRIMEDSEIFHKPSGNRVYSTDFLLGSRLIHPEKPVDIIGGPFMKDSIAPARSGRGSDRWARLSRGSVEDRERPARASGSSWTKDAASGGALHFGCGCKFRVPSRPSNSL